MCWYERVDVLAAPERTSWNYPAYGAEHLERLSFVRRARNLGFSLNQVRDLL
ncbi:MerR family DNA-binding protein [Belnapia rosea]|nr:MerR family DNA-binding protein [Belnapia rosea]